jgi:hypothetical protein
MIQTLSLISTLNHIIEGFFFPKVSSKWPSQHLIPWRLMNYLCINIHHPFLYKWRISFSRQIHFLLLPTNAQDFLNHVDFENNNKHVHFWNFFSEVINLVDIDFTSHFFSWVIFLNPILFIMICSIITILHLNCIVYENSIIWIILLLCKFL